MGCSPSATVADDEALVQREIDAGAASETGVAKVEEDSGVATKSATGLKQQTSSTCDCDDTADDPSTVGELPPATADIMKQYVIKHTLGKGASSRVVAASKQTGTGVGDDSAQFAIKIMSKERKAHHRLYHHEVAVLHRLHHPHIVNLLTHGHDESSFYIVSDLLTGGELFDRIVADDYEITEKKAANFVRQMLDALKHCHDSDIVHRDLKPENFVFAAPADAVADESSERVVLIDFGVAKAVKAAEVYSDVVGTVYYLAPELAAQSSSLAITGDVLKATDMWSIGVIAYVMMTGRPPFGGRSNREIFTNIVTKQLQFPAGVHLSKGFRRFVRKMLSKVPFKRYTVDQALDDPWVKGEMATDAKIHSDVLRYLRQFNYQSKFKKAITKTLAKTMSEDTEKQVSKHFHRLDKDGDGLLDVHEFEMLLNDLGYCPVAAKAEAKKMLEASDLNNDGTVDFDEFKAGWYRRLLSKSDKYVHMVFRVFDENGDGYIDAEELHTMLADTGGDMDNVLELIAEIDTDHDNRISFEEFLAAMTEKVLPIDDAQVGVTAVAAKDRVSMEIVEDDSIISTVGTDLD